MYYFLSLFFSCEDGFTLNILYSNQCFVWVFNLEKENGVNGWHIESTLEEISCCHGFIFYCCVKDSFVLHMSAKVCYCFIDFLSEHLLLSALCTYMLAIFESESYNHAEALKNWRGTEISIEEVGGSTLSGVFPL